MFRETSRGLGRTCDVALTLALPSRSTTYPPTASSGDAACVARTLSGEPDAFETLVVRYDRAVYHLCLRTMRDPGEARDCAQETFFKAYRSLRTYKPSGRFSTWILAIAYHACCDRLERRKRFASGDVPDVPDLMPGPDLLAERADAARTLRAAVDALPERYRTVIALYHLQGKQYDEIARILGLPLGTVKTHLFRAKALLREALLREALLREALVSD